MPRTHAKTGRIQVGVWMDPEVSAVLRTIAETNDRDFMNFIGDILAAVVKDDEPLDGLKLTSPDSLRKLRRLMSVK